jgi:hypothetical protein
MIAQTALYSAPLILAWLADFNRAVAASTDTRLEHHSLHKMIASIERYFAMRRGSWTSSGCGNIGQRVRFRDSKHRERARISGFGFLCSAPAVSSSINRMVGSTSGPAGPSVRRNTAATLACDFLEPYRYRFQMTTSSSSMSGPGDYLKLVPAFRPYFYQIMGVVWAVSWRRDTCKGTFHDSLLPVWAVGAENVSCMNPVSLALRLAIRGDCLGNLLRAVQPPTQFLGSVPTDNSDLIFTTVVVRHHMF